MEGKNLITFCPKQMKLAVEYYLKTVLMTPEAMKDVFVTDVQQEGEEFIVTTEWIEKKVLQP